MIGLLHDPEMSAEQRNLIAEKRAIYDSRLKKNDESREDSSSSRKRGSIATDLAGAGAETALKEPAESSSAFPPGATMCAKCNTNAVILMDGCATCLNCGYSKCG
jgi:hypothetical protein